MYLCYIDESGNTGQNLKDVHQPSLVLTALLVKPEHVKTIEEDIRALGFAYFAAESRNTDFEFHGDDIYNARGRYFKKLSLSRRIELLDRLVELLLKHQAIYVGYVCIKKSGYFATNHIQQTAFSLMVEHIEERLKGRLDAYGLLIADEQDELEQRLIDDLDHFKQHGTQFGYKRLEINRIIDSVHFVQSHNNYLMQLTDVICYIIRRGKDSREKLLLEYQVFNSENLDANPLQSFSEWVVENGHKGNRYFYKAYRRIQSKTFLFSKDFP